MLVNRIKDLKRCVIPITNSRTLIRVTGQDSVKMLQGLTTNNIARLVDVQHTNPGSLYTGFLSASGRLLFDAFVLHEQHASTITSSASSVAKVDNSANETLLIDVDSEVATRAIEHLNFYKMRNKLKIENATSDYSILTVLDKTYKSVRDDKLFVHLKEENCTVLMDPRHQLMGLRLLVPSSKASAINTVLSAFHQETEDVYQLYRAQNGIPQGLKDYSFDKIIPLEYNFDLLNGVDFHKGCYLGQELMSRTHYTGLIRKRVFPVVMSPANGNKSNLDPARKEHHLLFSQKVLDSIDVQSPEKDSELKITVDASTVSSPFNDPSTPSTAPPSRSSEKFLSGYNNVGLAMIKVDHIDASSFDSTKIIDNQGRPLQVIEPCWWSKVVGLQVPVQAVS
ncbi:hypothetical protein SAMD00019534_025580 [Acytostelium subglobosum LB1]|uniref:hypothetical protein n=1 Tax=Acytostelium subglobosum LB1 TaxID=1410327 RepID=UPI0006450647|nr:hypothetical protein SAMD00019534_025580 [Acytostelium subglobosum LB1]GAM19383.1 hypothetical protein SAMD00019534_025580 [Acytostelium subglobosum LB1]|eukprot:XP_012757310.1 hypothetical protein SAMD00019534_025580 [Acytostelium subglobosum LB1]